MDMKHRQCNERNGKRLVTHANRTISQLNVIVIIWDTQKRARWPIIELRILESHQPSLVFYIHSSARTRGGAAAHHHVTIIVNFMKIPSHMSITTFFLSLCFSAVCICAAASQRQVIFSTGKAALDKELVRASNIIHQTVDTIISSIIHHRMMAPAWGRKYVNNNHAPMIAKKITLNDIQIVPIFPFASHAMLLCVSVRVLDSFSGRLNRSTCVLSTSFFMLLKMGDGKSMKCFTSSWKTRKS